MDRRVPLWLAVAGVLLAAACGSGDGDDAGREPAATATTTATTTAAAPAAAAPESVAARPSGGCRAGAPVPAGEARVDLADGRWYLRNVPPAHDGEEPVPLVVDVHGYSEGAEVHTRMSALGPFGAEHGFVTVTPEGTGPVPHWDTALGSEDVAFVGRVLDDAERSLCVDRARVYVTGLSNGAMMTSVVACAYADRVAAVAPVAGIRAVDGCDPARPVPVVTFHGTDDGFLSYDGGLGESVADLPSADGSGRTLGEAGLPEDAQVGPSVPEMVAGWAARNGCEGGVARERVARDVTVLRHDCPPGAEVELYRVEGGGHAWPGSELSKAVADIVGRTTFSISANAVMWEFFEAHPLPRRG